MLYVLHGQDYKKRGRKLNELADFFISKSPDAVLVRVTPENLSRHDFNELAQGRGLFSERSVIILDGLLEEKENKEDLFNKIDLISASSNIFVVNERSIGKADEALLKKRAEKIQIFEQTQKYERSRFNIFSLAEAFGMRDKKRAWTIFLRAIENGSEPEEIHGTIFWQLKTILLVKSAERTTVETTGLKPFVLAKAKTFANNFSKEELHNISSRLVSLYHDSHRGRGDFSIGLEKLILETL